jgi:hypothetical protein
MAQTQEAVTRAALVIGEASDVLEELGEEASELPTEPSPAEGEAEPEELPDDDADELPPAAALIAQAEAALQQARDRVARLDAERPVQEQRVASARMAVLEAVTTQLAARECRWRGYWPAADDGVVQACTDDVAAQALAYRQAREAGEQLEQTRLASRTAVYAAEQALEADKARQHILYLCGE